MPLTSLTVTHSWPLDSSVRPFSFFPATGLLWSKSWTSAHAICKQCKVFVLVYKCYRQKTFPNVFNFESACKVFLSLLYLKLTWLKGPWQVLWKRRSSPACPLGVASHLPSPTARPSLLEPTISVKRVQVNIHHIMFPWTFVILKNLKRKYPEMIECKIMSVIISELWKDYIFFLTCTFWF